MQRLSSVSSIYKDLDFEKIFKISTKGKKVLKTNSSAKKENNREGVVLTKIMDVDKNGNNFSFLLEYYFEDEKENRKRVWIDKLYLLIDRHRDGLICEFEEAIMNEQRKMREIEENENLKFQASLTSNVDRKLFCGSKRKVGSDVTNGKNMKLKIVGEFKKLFNIKFEKEKKLKHFNVEKDIIDTDAYYKLEDGDIMPNYVSTRIQKKTEGGMLKKRTPKKAVFEVETDERWQKKREERKKIIEEKMDEIYNGDLLLKKFEDLENFTSIYLYEKILNIKKEFIKSELEKLSKSEVFHQLDSLACNFMVDFSRKLTSLKPDLRDIEGKRGRELAAKKRLKV